MLMKETTARVETTTTTELATTTTSTTETATSETASEGENDQIDKGTHVWQINFEI